MYCCVSFLWFSYITIMSVYSQYYCCGYFQQCLAVVRPSVNSGCEKLPIHHISRAFFQHFKFHIFMIFCFILLSIGPMRAKISKRYSSNKLFTAVFFSNSPDFFFLKCHRKVIFSEFWNVHILNFNGLFHFPIDRLIYKSTPKSFQTSSQV